MSFLLLDPPWESNFDPDALRAWIGDLEAMRREYAADLDAVQQIDRQLDQERGTLAVWEDRLRRGLPIGGDPEITDLSDGVEEE